MQTHIGAFKISSRVILPWQLIANRTSLHINLKENVCFALTESHFSGLPKIHGISFSGESVVVVTWAVIVVTRVHWCCDLVLLFTDFTPPITDLFHFAHFASTKHKFH